ncbi:MAG: hypothetical protein WBR21_08335 [Rouxiella badensis]|uniref:hypothetical protein n=1 Tax=Rouxiella badensis TaxID=1646377 RepID=UPI003C50A7BD
MSKPEESGLERDYCAGQLTLRDMAEIYGISEGAIRKRAKKNGWVRKEKSGTQKSTQVRKSGTQKKEVRTTAKPAAPAKSDDEKKNAGEEDSDPPENTKPIRGSRTAPPLNAFQPRNQVALKHGGYARRLLLTDEVIEDAKALTLEDELFRLRASNLVASENIGRWTTQLEDAEKDQVKAITEKISAADKAMMRNTVRIESIEHTLTVMNKAAADTTYRVATTEKVELEVGKLKLQLGKPEGELERTDTTNLTPEEAAEAYRQLMG